MISIACFKQGKGSRTFGPREATMEEADEWIEHQPWGWSYVILEIPKAGEPVVLAASETGPNATPLVYRPSGREARKGEVVYDTE